MSNGSFRRFVLLGLVLAGLLLIAPARSFAADIAIGGDPLGEAMTHEIDTLFGQFADSAQEEPVFTDLGGGFYSLSMTLSPALRERLLEAMSSDGVADKAQASSLTVISVGQAPASPSNPITTTHGAFSDATFPYTYWVITLNLGPQTVTKATTLKLTGPGLKFNRTQQVVYGANGIWVIGFRPGSGVGRPGIYTLQGSVSGGGSMTTKSFAVNP
jgi:hypothetical protein